MNEMNKLICFEDSTTSDMITIRLSLILLFCLSVLKCDMLTSYGTHKSQLFHSKMMEHSIENFTIYQKIAKRNLKQWRIKRKHTIPKATTTTQIEYKCMKIQ